MDITFIQDFHEGVFRAGLDMLKKKGRNVPAVIFTATVNDLGISKVGLMHIDHGDFEGVSKQLRYLPYAPGVDIMAMASFVWMVEGQDPIDSIKKMKETGEFEDPSESDDKYPALMIYIKTKDARYIAHHRANFKTRELEWAEFKEVPKETTDPQ